MFKVSQRKSQPNVFRTIQFSEELSSILKEIAARENVSFNEMVAPFQMYGEYYAQQEQLASKLAEEAALFSFAEKGPE